MCDGAAVCLEFLSLPGGIEGAGMAVSGRWVLGDRLEVCACVQNSVWQSEHLCKHGIFACTETLWMRVCDPARLPRSICTW